MPKPIACARISSTLIRSKSWLITSPHDVKIQLEITHWLFDHAKDDEGARWALKILADRPNDPEASRLLAGYHDRRGETGLANFYRVHATPENASATKAVDTASPRPTPPINKPPQTPGP